MFVVPQFPIVCNLWTGPAAVGPPRVAGVPCNLAFGRRTPVQWWDWAGLGLPGIWMQLLVPARTDIRGFQSATGSDVAEVPAGSGRFYVCDFVDDIGRGFLNEHRFALLQQSLPWPTPDP